MIQERGAAVIAARKLSSAMSAAHAIAAHLKDWLMPADSDSADYVSMAVISDGNPYGIPPGLVFSFPVTCSDGRWEFVKVRCSANRCDEREHSK